VRRRIDGECPAIARRAEAGNARILRGGGTGAGNQGRGARGHAPKGETPVARGPARRAGAGMIPAAGNRGGARFMVCGGGLKADPFPRFPGRLIKDAKRRVFPIAGNPRAHRAGAVRARPADRAGRIELSRLPPRGPGPNPGGYLGDTPKARLRNQPPAPAHPGLKNRIPKAMRSARRSPGLVRSLFHHPPAVHAA